MAKTLEWRANTAGSPSKFRHLQKPSLDAPAPEWACSCFGIIDYIYGCWWKCRSCGRWHEHTPSV